MSSENGLLRAETARQMSETANTRAMLHLRATQAIREAAVQGMTHAIMPYANVPSEVSTLFSKDLADRGYSAVYDPHAPGLYGHEMPVLVIFWNDGSGQRGIT